MDVAASLAQALRERQVRVVFAESCTGGLVSAELASIPGISDWLCGSAVTYRCATKSAWLGVSEEKIASETAVSEVVASQMAKGVLRKTPEAGLAVSITGHLGPGAPDGFDGLVFVGVAQRRGDQAEVRVARHELQLIGRVNRQREAAALVLRTALSEISTA